MHYFSDINISQGSVATYLRYGGILVLVLLQISQRLCASESFFFYKRSIFDEDMAHGQMYGVTFSDSRTNYGSYEAVE